MCQEEGICMEGSSGQRVLAASLLRITSFEAGANHRLENGRLVRSGLI